MSSKFNDLPLWKQHTYSLLFSVTCMGGAIAAASIHNGLLPNNTTNIPMIFLLAVIIVIHYTVPYWYGLACCLFSLLYIRHYFAYYYVYSAFPLSGYPLTFLIMAAIVIFVCASSSHLSAQNDIIREREKQLLKAEVEKVRANLLRAVSHDLRTPLTGIIGSSSLLLEQGEQLGREEQKSLLLSINEEADWLLNMVENLLAVTRIQGDNLSIVTTEEPVEEIISGALQKIQRRYPDSLIRVKIPDDLILLPMDAILIEQVIINLMANAIIHSGSKKPIDLIVQNLPTSVSFTIKDYGIGLSSDQTDYLFDNISFVPSQASDGYKGLGIGLSICKTIITAHQGTLLGQNHGSGAEFIFTLPKIPSH